LNIDSKKSRKTHVRDIHGNMGRKKSMIDSNICPKCGGNLVLRDGRYGRFKGCANYPKCRFVAKQIRAVSGIWSKL